MPEMSDAEALSFLKKGSGEDIAPQPRITPTDIVPSSAPLTGAALRSAMAQLKATEDARLVRSPRLLTEEEQRQGERLGFAFDSSGGIPFLPRLRMEFQRTPEDKLKALQVFYGKNQVRTNEFGDFIVTVNDPKTGIPTDIKADPEGPDVGDWGKLVAALPAVAGALLTTKGIPASSAAGFIRTVWTLLRGSAGAVAGERTKDIVNRATFSQVDERPLLEAMDFEEMVKASVVETSANMFLGGAQAGVGGVLGRIATPIRSPALGIIAEGNAARQELIAKHNLPETAFPQTIGQATGLKFAQRGEAFMRNQPGASQAFDEIEKESNAQMDSFLSQLAGGRSNVPPPSNEALGERAIAALGQEGRMAEGAIDVSRAQLARQAQSEIEDATLAATGTIRPVEVPAVGEALRVNANSIRAAREASTRMKYQDVYAQLPKGDDAAFIDQKALAKDAGVLYDKLISDTKKTSQPSGLLDEFGRPQMSEVTTKQPLSDFIPPGVVARLSTLKDLESPKSLSELVEMRADVRNAIKQNEVVPGYQAHHLGDIEDMLTKNIKEGLRKYDPSGKLVGQWEAANQAYRSDAEAFSQKGIRELFLEEGKVGAISNAQLVERALKGTNSDAFFKAYKDFFGPSHPVLGLLKRAVLDDVMLTSPINTRVNAAGFLQRLESLSREAPNITQEIFGNVSAVKELRKSGIALKGSTTELDAFELRDLITSGKTSASDFQKLVQAQDFRDDLYLNSIIRDSADATLGRSTRLNPTEFTERFAFKAEPSDVSKAMEAITRNQPGLVQPIQEATLTKVVQTARNDKGVVTASGIESVLKSEDTRARLAAILGDSILEDLSLSEKYLKPIQMVDKMFGRIGSFGTSTKTGHLIEGSLGSKAQYVKEYLQSKITSALYLNRDLSNYFKNHVVTDEAAGNIVKMIAGSEPMTKAVLGLSREWQTDFEDAVRQLPGGEQRPMTDEEALRFLRR